MKSKNWSRIILFKITEIDKEIRIENEINIEAEDLAVLIIKFQN